MEPEYKKVFSFSILALLLSLVAYDAAENISTTTDNNFTANISGQPAFNGSVTFIAGDNITLSQINRTITINATGGAGGGGVTNQTVDPWNVNASNLTSGTVSKNGMPANVTYNDSLNNFSVNQSFGGVLFVDTTNKRVGVGTEFPSSVFSVVTQSDLISLFKAKLGYSSFELRDQNTTNQALVDFREGTDPGVVNARINVYSRNQTFTPKQFTIENRMSGGDIRFQTTTSGGVRSTRLLINESGNVGINTITPQYKLDVVGGVNATNFTASGNISAMGNISVRGNLTTASNLSAKNITITGLIAESASGDALCYEGSIIKRNTGQTTCLVSSAKYKTNISYITVDSSGVLKLLKAAKYEDRQTGIKRVGFIAEDIDRDISQYAKFLVVYEPDNSTNPRGLNYEGLLTLAVKSLQEQIEINEQQTALLSRICANNQSLCVTQP